MNFIEYTIYFVPVLIGFLLGEILCQSHSHNAYKWRYDRNGFMSCLEHSVLYTAAIVASMYVFCSVSPLNVAMLLSVFFGHFVVEKINVTRWWLSAMKMEDNPMSAYYNRKVGEELGEEAMHTDTWVDYALSQPDVSMTEGETTSIIFYMTEYMATTRTIQFLVTFITIMVLAYLDYI